MESSFGYNQTRIHLLIMFILLLALGLTSAVSSTSSLSVPWATRLRSQGDATYSPNSADPGPASAIIQGKPGPTVTATSVQTPGSTFSRFVDRAVGSIPTNSLSVVNEPSIANNGNAIFYTGNWYAARSTDGGLTWTYVDPAADMTLPGGATDFCCDQDVIFDPGRSIFLWYRQGCPQISGACNYNTPSGVFNRFRLGVSSDISSNANWFFYDVNTTDVDPAWTNQWFDYPSLALSSNYLYILTNVFNGGTFQRSVILRWSLESLKNHQAMSFNHSTDADASTLAPVQGATTTLYWGTHPTTSTNAYTSTLRLYSWPESSTSPTSTDIAITSFTRTTRGSAACPSTDGGDACARFDDRILGGWVAGGVIGFAWNVAQGSGYPFPYTYIVRITESTRAFRDSPVIWNSNYAWIYGWASPNARGDLGLVAFCTGATSGVCNFPTFTAGILTLNAATPPWELYTIIASTNGPTSDSWGDYIRVRPYSGTGNIWVAAGYRLSGGGANANAEPRYLLFGRPGDDPLTLAASPTSRSVFPGSAPTSTITVNGGGGFAGTVTLTVSVTPTGPTGSLNPTSVTLSSTVSSATAILTISIPSITTPGTYVATITATTGPLTRTTTFTINVVDFTISAGPVSPATVNAGSTATSTITVASLNNFAGAVSFGSSPSPGLTCTPAASVALPPSPRTTPLSCTAAVAGDYTVTVTGSSTVGGFTVSHTTSAITFHFVDFTIQPSSPITVSCYTDVTCDVSIILTAQNGFAGTVSLSSNPSPGLTSTLTASSVTLPPSPLTVTLKVKASTIGDYTVTVTGTSNVNGGTLSHNTATITVHVTPVPLAISISYTPQNPVVGETVTFTANAAGGTPPYSYAWRFCCIVTPTESFDNPTTRQFPVEATYEVRLTVTDSLGQTQTIYNYIFVAGMQVSFTYSPSSPTPGSAVTFIATTRGGTAPFSFSWNFGDGTTGTGNPASHTYPVHGAYTVMVTVNDASYYSATSSQTVTVQFPLFASFSFAPTSPTTGQTVTFTASVSGGAAPYNIQWNFGDGGTALGSQVTHSYSNIGTYTVLMTVTDSAGQDASSTQSITVQSSGGGGGGGGGGGCPPCPLGPGPIVQVLAVTDRKSASD